MARKKTRKVAKPKAPPLKVDAVKEWESNRVTVQCKEQLIEMAGRFKQPLFYELEDEVLFFVYNGAMFYCNLNTDEVKELDYDEWVDEED